jgi:hypothetical protein
MKCLIALATLVIVSCSTSKNAGKGLPAAQQNFWEQLNRFCGKSFYGKIVDAPANDTVFRNRELILHIRSCEPNRIKMPFIVGSNYSRTFILTKTAGGLLWQHDHRHHDGTADSITMYGGHTTNPGSSSVQIFPADEHTASMLPAAIGNVWWVEIKEGRYIHYNLRRMGTDRLFTVRFDTQDAAPDPPPPWGWN